MLKLQFVEVCKSHSEKIILEDLPLQTIGHDSDIKPKITNGHLSRKHCTIVYYSALHCWRVTDGSVDNQSPSRNGLWNKEGSKIEGHVMLSNLGDRVYLLKIPNNEAYLEVVDDSLPELKSRSTSGLEIQIAELTTTAEKVADTVSDVKQAVVSNRAGIDQVKVQSEAINAKVSVLTSTLESVLDQIETVGKEPKVYFLGATVSFLMLMMALFGFAVYTNIGKIVDYQLEHHGNTNLQKK